MHPALQFVSLQTTSTEILFIHHLCLPGKLTHFLENKYAYIFFTYRQKTHMDFQKLYSTTCILEQTHENQQKVKIYSHEQRIRCSFSMQLFSKPCDLSKSSQIMAKGSGSSHLSCRRFPNPLLKVKISNRTSRSLSLTVSHI